MFVAEAGKAQQKSVSMVGGIVITTGTAVGAGMFSLPVISSGMWFGWAIVAMVVSCFILYHVSMMILEVNMHFEPGASFDTMVAVTLGKRWNTFNGLLLAFLFYILDYAYISGGGSIVNQTLISAFGVAPPQQVSGLLFAFTLAFVVWLSTKAVDRVTTVLLTGMLISFALATFDFTLSVNIDNLIDGGSQESHWGRMLFMFAALPYFLTSFGYYGTVPSLVKYYGKKPHLIGRAMLIGSLLIFTIYFFWLMSTLGNLSQAAFLPVIEKGGNIGVLVSAMNDVVNSDALSKMLSVFANMAIISSFLGVSLALFDFIADKFNFDDSGLGRLKTAAIVFVPPTIGGVLFPNGFIAAIGFAGLVAAVNALIVPPLMFKKSREMYGKPNMDFAAAGIKMANFLIVMGVVYVSCNVFKLLGWLPVFGR